MYNKLKIREKLVTVLCFVLLSLVVLGSTKAVLGAGSNIYFNGPNTAMAPGSEFYVDIFLDTDTPINALNLSVSFPKEQIEFLNSDNSDSIIDIWQNRPSVLSDGSVGFSGGILKPFVGNKSPVIKLAFKVLPSGSSSGFSEISFSKKDLYIADGKGTIVEASASKFSFATKEDAKVVSSPITPFQPTEADIIIGENLETLKSQNSQKVLIFSIIGGVVLVFGIVLVYNKRKRQIMR